MAKTTHNKVCAHCGEPFTTIDKRQRFCARACLHASQSVQFGSRVELRCQQCGKLFYEKPSRAHLRKHCSKACDAAAREAKITLTCKACGVSFERLPSRSGDYCSYTCMGADQRRRVIKTCSVCGKPFETETARAEKRSTCSRACKRIEWTSTIRSNMFRRGETKPEQQARKALDQIGVPYLPQHPVAGYVLDFYLPNHSIALEIDGQYWHTLPGAPARDAHRDRALQVLGITTVRITDSELFQAIDHASLLRHRLSI